MSEPRWFPWTSPIIPIIPQQPEKYFPGRTICALNFPSAQRSLASGWDDKRLITIEFSNHCDQHYALVEGATFQCEGRPCDLVNIHLTGEIRWRVELEHFHLGYLRQDEQSAISYFGLSPATGKPLAEEVLFEATRGYLIVSKARPDLVHCFGQDENDLGAPACRHLYMTRPAALKAWKTLRDPQLRVVLEVTVSP